jgi:hypothetical protein
MPAGQSGHCQCISQVNTDFFQNNTTNHNTILKHTIPDFGTVAVLLLKYSTV